MTTKKSRKQKAQDTKYDTEIWLNKYWRPMCAVTYLVICIFDFLVAPVLFGMHSFIVKSQMIQSWIPLTIQAGGLFHISFGAILSVATWTRGTEKVAMMNNQPSYQSNYQPSYQPQQNYPQQQYQQPIQNANTAPTGDLNAVSDTQALPPVKKPIKRL